MYDSKGRRRGVRARQNGSRSPTDPHYQGHLGVVGLSIAPCSSPPLRRFFFFLQVWGAFDREDGKPSHPLCAHSLDPPTCWTPLPPSSLLDLTIPDRSLAVGFLRTSHIHVWRKLARGTQLPHARPPVLDGCFFGGRNDLALHYTMAVTASDK